VNKCVLHGSGEYSKLIYLDPMISHGVLPAGLSVKLHAKYLNR
jgi:hypothetical protein